MTTSRGCRSELSELNNPTGHPEDDECAKVYILYFMPDITTVTNDDHHRYSDTSISLSPALWSRFHLPLALFRAFPRFLRYPLFPTCFMVAKDPPRAMLQSCDTFLWCPFTCYCDLPRLFPCVIYLAIAHSTLTPSVIHPGDAYVHLFPPRVS